MKKFFAGVLVAALTFVGAHAQSGGAATNHAFLIGKGPTVTGYTSLLCASGQLAVGSATDPVCRTVSGDATFAATGVITLATVNGNVGTFGSATQCVTVAANAKGLITGISQTACTGSSGISQLTGDVTAGPGSGSQAATLAAVITAGGPTGSATAAPIITFDAKGRLTAVSSATITPAIGSVTGLGSGVSVAAGNNVNSTGGLLTYNPAGANKIQSLGIGSGTITTPTGAAWVKFTLVGGGGGGSGAGAAAGNGTAGNPACINTSGAACTTPVLQAGGGAGGLFSTGFGGAGGTTSGSGTCNILNVAGGDGKPTPTLSATVATNGAEGGNSSLGGAGGATAGNAVGAAGKAFSGGGGQGGGAPSTSTPGAGGGAGATCVSFIQTPAASYTYVVPATAAGGTAGAGAAGGAGGSGTIIAEFGFN